jgi:glycosyltransferase involved in cell wall biosynthesis
VRSVVHRLIWRRLPRSARRAALFGLTSLAAPRRDPGARPREPIIVVGCLRSATGLGESARLCYGALQASGFDVRGIDVSSVLLQPRDFPDYEFRDGGSLHGPATLVMHVNAPLMPLVLMSIDRQMLRDKWIVGYWAWELPIVPREWERATPFVHEIWVPSAFVAAAVAGRIKDRPIRVLPHPVAVSGRASGATASRTPGPFTALVIFNMGSSMARKNPIAAIEAFQRAFVGRSDARLIVKVTGAELFPDGARRLHAEVEKTDNATIIYKTLAANELSELYRQSDCLISLHRSEGFGLSIAEAMLEAVPAICTDWSGPTDFVTRDTGHPVGYRLISARDPQHTYDFPDLFWADADVAAAAQALRDVREQPDGRGERARAEALARFSPTAYASRVQHVLGLKSLPAASNPAANHV